MDSNTPRIDRFVKVLVTLMAGGLIGFVLGYALSKFGHDNLETAISLAVRDLPSAELLSYWKSGELVTIVERDLIAKHRLPDDFECTMTSSYVLIERPEGAFRYIVVPLDRDLEPYAMRRPPRADDVAVLRRTSSSIGHDGQND
jgi:hypothetical protein